MPMHGCDEDSVSDDVYQAAAMYLAGKTFVEIASYHAVELPLNVEHRDGYGAAGEFNAMVPGIHLPIHDDAAPLHHGNQVNVHLLRLRQVSFSQLVMTFVC